MRRVCGEGYVRRTWEVGGGRIVVGAILDGEVRLRFEGGAGRRELSQC